MLADIGMLLMVEKGIKVELVIMLIDAKASNKYKKYFDENIVPLHPQPP